MTIPKSLWLGAVSLVLMAVGATGPWAKVLGIVTIHGTDDSKDGWIVVGAAGASLVALVLVLATRLRWLALISLIAGGIGAATAAYDVSDINGVGGGNVASAQWGIYLALAGSIAMILTSIAVIAEVRQPAPPPAPTPEPAESPPPPAPPA